MKKSCAWGVVLGIATLGAAQAAPPSVQVTSVDQVVNAPAVARPTEQISSTNWVEWFNLGTRVLDSVLNSVNTGKQVPPEDTGEVVNPENKPAENPEPSVREEPSSSKDYDYDSGSDTSRRTSADSWRDRYAKEAAYSDFDFWEKSYRYVLNDSALNEAVAVTDIPLGWLVEGSAWPTNAKGDYSWAYGLVSADGTTWAYYRQSPDQPIASIKGTIAKVSQKQVKDALGKYREEMAGAYVGKCQEIDSSYNVYDLYEVEGLKDDYNAMLKDVVAVQRLGYCQGHTISLDSRDIFAFLKGPFDLVERKVKGKSVVEIYPLYGIGYIYSELDIVPRQFKQAERLNSKLCSGYYGTLKSWNKRRTMSAKSADVSAKKPLGKATKKTSGQEATELSSAGSAVVYSPQQMKDLTERLQRGRCYFFNNKLTGSLFSFPEVGTRDVVWFDDDDNIVVANQDTVLNEVQGFENGSWRQGEEESRHRTSARESK